MGDTDNGGGPLPEMHETERGALLKLLLELFDPTAIAILIINGIVLVAFLAFLLFLKIV